ncbi:MAG TPA: hypothetical protein VJJ72_01020 [Candidatus Paceibacterota bacterium]
MTHVELPKNDVDRMVEAFIEKKWRDRIQKAEEAQEKVMIKVKRKDGSIEDGWELYDIRDNDAGGTIVKLAVAKKIIPGKPDGLRRFIPLIELEALNSGGEKG